MSGMLTRPVFLLRFEGAALLAFAVTVFAVLGGSWWLFVLLLFAPDLAMLGYLRGPKLGAAVYNLGHWTLLPVTLGLLGFALGQTLAMQIAAIWLAHIGLDRAVGYGLKLPSDFGQTHLGPIGRGGRRA